MTPPTLLNLEIRLRDRELVQYKKHREADAQSLAIDPPARTAGVSRGVPELTRNAGIQLKERLRLRCQCEVLSQPEIVGGTSALEVIELMDSSQRCKDQAAESIRLMNSARTEAQARLLRNISFSWLRLAGQIDRYNEFVREQGLH
jgi:hypothetical protein